MLASRNIYKEEYKYTNIERLTIEDFSEHKMGPNAAYQPSAST